jgi:hypothetical protein
MQKPAFNPMPFQEMSFVINWWLLACYEEGQTTAAKIIELSIQS